MTETEIKRPRGRPKKEKVKVKFHIAVAKEIYKMARRSGNISKWFEKAGRHFIKTSGYLK